MTQLSDTVSNGYIQAFGNFLPQVHKLAAELSEDQFWTRPYPYGNSFGHLVLHLTGNLNYFIGTQMANTGYVRNREEEFSSTERLSKDETLGRLDEAVALVVETLKEQKEEDWSEHYEAKKSADFIKDRFSIFLRCTTHFHHHMGQMIYLTKAFAVSGK